MIPDLDIGQVWVLQRGQPYWPRWNGYYEYCYEAGEKFVVKGQRNYTMWLLLDGQGRELLLTVEHIQQCMEFIPEES